MISGKVILVVPLQYYLNVDTRRRTGEMTQDSDDLLAMVFSAPINLPPTQVKSDTDVVVTASETMHIESHHSSSYVEANYHSETQIVETHNSSSQQFHSETHIERSDTNRSINVGDIFQQDPEEAQERRNTALSTASRGTSVSGLSQHTHEQSYDLPRLEDVLITQHETHVHELHRSDSQHSESTLVSNHGHHVEEGHAPGVLGDIKNPIAPYRTPVHDAVIEQFKSLHKRDSVASSAHSMESNNKDLTPVKVTHYKFDSEDAHVAGTKSELDVLKYTELSTQPLPRVEMTEQTLPHVEKHIEHHDSDEQQFTFEHVEYDYERYGGSNQDQQFVEREITQRHSTHEQRNTEFYDPYSQPNETHISDGRDEVSQELVDHVVGEIMRAVTLPGDSDNFYDTRSSISSIHSNRKPSNVALYKTDYTYSSAHDKEHHRHSPLLVNTDHRRDTTGEVEIRTQMHASGHSTLVRHSNQKNSDIPSNTGAVKKLRQKLEKLEMGLGDHHSQKLHKEINIFESLDNNSNYEEIVAAPVIGDVSRHQFHELRFRGPYDFVKKTARPYENIAHHDESTGYESSEESVQYHHIHHHDIPETRAQDNHHHHRSSAQYRDNRQQHHNDGHYQDTKKVQVPSARHHEDHRLHHHVEDHTHHDTRKSQTRAESGGYHEDERFEPHLHEAHHHHEAKTHIGHYHVDRHSHNHDHHLHHHHEPVYEPYEYLNEVDDIENQLTVSELTNVFGGAIKLRKPDHHQEERRPLDRTSSTHHAKDTLQTAAVGAKTVTTKTNTGALHHDNVTLTKLVPAAVVASQYPQKVQPARATPVVTPAPAVARLPRASSEQFNSIRVVRNFNTEVAEGIHQTHQEKEVHPPQQVIHQQKTTVSAQKVPTPAPVAPRTNVIRVHQDTQKQTVVNTHGSHYSKMDTALKHSAVVIPPAPMPVPAKREHYAPAHIHPTPVDVPFYSPMPCCCCNHLMHLHQQQQPQLAYTPGHAIMPMYQYHDGHHQHHDHVYPIPMHHHNHEDNRECTESEHSFVLASVSERRAAYEEKSAAANTSVTHDGPKPMVNIYAN
ncbi:hypothetical protein Q1695_000864 [Nippostrongylus brasiliensis]|nr:hypothetical protein Q1695_000864 [Nippostrongylus brasiliensis]